MDTKGIEQVLGTLRSTAAQAAAKPTIAMRPDPSMLGPGGPGGPGGLGGPGGPMGPGGPGPMMGPGGPMGRAGGNGLSGHLTVHRNR